MTPTSLPGWRPLPGMRMGAPRDGAPGGMEWTRVAADDELDGCHVRRVGLGAQPDLDDPATGGAMLALLGEEVWRIETPAGYGRMYVVTHGDGDMPSLHTTLARACVSVAVSLGRWPGVSEL